MSLWSRLENVFRGERLNREIDEEIESHIAEAIEQGRDPAEARRAFGSALQVRETSRDLRMLAWLESLRADAVFGWRQIRKRRATSAAAILSLALAIGACTAAFRLVDALLLRPLPVANPERIFSIARQGLGPSGDYRISESSEYPLFRRMRAAVRNEAELIAVSYADRTDLTFGSDEEMEKAWRQYVSGWMFSSFGLRPAAGRLFTENDDRTPGAHPYAVLSYDYWSRRFGRDPKVVGRSFRLGNDLYEIVGVAPQGFTGTEPGTFIDIFLPTMMNPWVERSDASWFRPFAVLKPGVAIEPLRTRLDAIQRTFNEERARAWTSQTKLFLERFLNQKLLLQPAASGVSGMQNSYSRSLVVLSVLVALVLLIACANVANLITAQAAARAREMALRVSIGAGRWRLVQMVLVESALLGFLAAAIGGLFAWWAAPFVVGRINPPDNPARLALPADWRVLGFGMALALAVTFVFGLAPALRASSLKPASALKGGDDPHSRRRLMHTLISAQVAFCFIVHFSAGLFVASFHRLANQPLGFSPEGVLTLDSAAKRPQPAELWEQVSDHLRTVGGVQSVALAAWPLLSGTGSNGFIWVNGAPTEVLAYFLAVSPGWIDTMRIPLIEGRDLRPGETYPNVAIVNQAFVRQCLGGDANPVGKWFERETGDGVTRARLQVVGVAGDARYRNMREPITPTAYVPFASVDRKGAPQPKGSATFVVRTSSPNPGALGAILRQEVPRARPEFRVSNIRSQVDLDRQHTVRERLLAMLGVFFAAVALLLSGIGLYGVLDYSVLQRRREIGIRIAIGAPAADIARRVIVEALYMVLVGAVAGLVVGLASVRFVAALLYQVHATEMGMLVPPCLTILASALLAALPALVRAVRIDPVAMLRAE
jgi:putative ABC transport system permease protein